MSLSAEDRNSLIALEKEKTMHFLAQADENYNNKVWDIAANRFYYACFHAVHALFLHNGISSYRHAGMLRQFGLHFITTGILSQEFGAFLTRMEQLREKGDYNCMYEITPEEMTSMVEPAHRLIDRVFELLDMPPTTASVKEG